MLEGIRVLDCCDERGHLAGKILGDMGADVIKVEPPGGDPLRRRGPFAGGVEGLDRGIPWLANNTSKRSVVLDLDRPEARRTLLELAAEADVLLETSPVLAADEREGVPRLVRCSITPFGLLGPRAPLCAHDLVVVAMGGNAAMTGDPDGPPLRCSLPTSHFHSGPEAVIGILTALLARESNGRGQDVDVSMQECQLGTLLTGPGQLALTGIRTGRTGARLGRTREIWAARDGWISFGLRGGPARASGFQALVAWMDEAGMAPSWLLDIDWATWSPHAAPTGALARLEDAFAAFFRTRSRQELYERALERRILLAPCNDGAAILAHPQLRSRGLFARPAGGGPELPISFARWDGPGDLRVRRRAPLLGEHQHEGWRPRAPADGPPESGSAAARSPYEDLRILELGSGAAGPVATRYFAEYGATVVRVESGKRPDFLRLLQPEGRAGMDRAPMFALLNPDKRSLTLDMTQPEARAILERLVDWADVVSENFSPGVVERWGLGPDAMRERKPELIVVQGCLFGQTGPQRHYPGFGGQGSAIAGFNHLTGPEGGEALGPYATITDSLSPRYIAAALAGAILQRRRTGRGGALDVSQIETGVYSLSEMIIRESAGAAPARRIGNRCEWAAPHGIYRCRGQDRWVAISVFDDAQWKSLAAEAELDGRAASRDLDLYGGRLAREPEVDAWIADWTRDLEAEDVMARLQARGVAAGAVQDFSDLLEDPQLAFRGHFVPVSHPVLGGLRVERSGFRLSAIRGGFRRAGPCLGEHSRQILEEIVGLEPGEIARLEETEVVG